MSGMAFYGFCQIPYGPRIQILRLQILILKPNDDDILFLHFLRSLVILCLNAIQALYRIEYYLFITFHLSNSYVFSVAE
jgi:hypothetical protein